MTRVDFGGGKRVVLVKLSLCGKQKSYRFSTPTSLVQTKLAIRKKTEKKLVTPEFGTSFAK